MRTRISASLLALAVAATASAQTAQVNGRHCRPKAYSGRPATDKDVIAGNAVFVLRAYGSFRQADRRHHSAIRLFDQDRRKTHARHGRPRRVGKGIKIFGVRDLDGNKATAKTSS